MLATARGVAIKPKASTPGGNVIVFSAATGDETAYPYDEKGHGLFTYFLLKKLQENKGNVTLGELSAYLRIPAGTGWTSSGNSQPQATNPDSLSLTRTDGKLERTKIKVKHCP